MARFVLDAIRGARTNRAMNALQVKHMLDGRTSCARGEEDEN